MTPETRQDYLKALGIPGFLYVTNESNKAISEPVKCLVIETGKEHSFCRSGHCYDLLEKMLGAIGLPMSEVKCVCATKNTLSSVIENNPANAILIMDKTLKSTLDHVFTTFHPHEIFTNPTLKREAWEVLKEIKKCLKQIILLMRMSAQNLVHRMVRSVYCCILAVHPVREK